MCVRVSGGLVPERVGLLFSPELWRGPVGELVN